VSGQNVAFVLALLGPARRRLGLGGRWLTATAAIAAFALLTRFEPSVLRASFMAGLAVTATALGRPTSTVRLLALAVAALVLVDPLLVHSVGFQLSVAASAGIVLIGPRLASALPGPSPLPEALAVTLAAQLGVAPVLLLVFGDLPVAAVPANLLATPVAGVVVAWGLGAGLAAGVVSEPLAATLHLPTSASIGWIELVARRAAAAPLGELGAAHVLAAAAGTGLLVLDRHRRRLVRQAAAVLLLLALVTPAVGLRRPPRVWTPLADGSALWRAGGATALALGGSTGPEPLLEALRRAGVRRVDVVISGGGGARAAALVSAVRHRWRPASVLAPDGHAIPGAVTPPVGSAARVGDLELDVAANRPRLQVRVRPVRPP
jgi:competence protein ComEC